MRLLTSNIRGRKRREAARFMIVGTLGTALQYILYAGFLEAFRWIFPELELVTLAFTISYVIEVFFNYLLTAYYTFSSKPSMTNAGGFAAGRVLNYLVQIGLLHLTLSLTHDEQLSGIVAILLSGILNFFVMHFLFKKS